MRISLDQKKEGREVILQRAYLLKYAVRKKNVDLLKINSVSARSQPDFAKFGLSSQVFQQIWTFGNALGCPETPAKFCSILGEYNCCCSFLRRCFEEVRRSGEGISIFFYELSATIGKNYNNHKLHRNYANRAEIDRFFKFESDLIILQISNHAEK